MAYCCSVNTPRRIRLSRSTTYLLATRPIRRTMIGVPVWRQYFFQKTGNLVDLEQTGHSIQIRCQGIPYWSKPYQWHETRVHKLTEAEDRDTSVALHLEISFWADEIPADVLHLDTSWFPEDFNCDLRFSKERFPEPEKEMARLKSEGFRVSLWQWNYVSRRDDNPNFVEGRDGGFFAVDENGKLYAPEVDAEGEWIDDAIIDFTNPEAAEWYTSQIAGVLRKGEATIKTDFGEGIPPDAVFKEITGRRQPVLLCRFSRIPTGDAEHRSFGILVLLPRHRGFYRYADSGAVRTLGTTRVVQQPCPNPRSRERQRPGAVGLR